MPSTRRPLRRQGGSSGDSSLRSNALRLCSVWRKTKSSLFLYHCFLRVPEVIFFSLCFRWHSAGTFDVKTKTGGPFGTMRHAAEQAHGSNNGLDIAVRLLEPLKQEFSIISYADFYQVTKYNSIFLFYH